MISLLLSRWISKVGVLTVVVLSWCAVTWSSPGAAQTTIEFIYLAGAQASEDRFRLQTEAFEARYPDIKVNRIRVTNNYLDRLIALIVAGSVPDVIALDISHLMAFSDGDFLQDLNPFLSDPSFESDRIAAPLLNAYSVDGKLYAVPLLANPSAYVYNADLFDEAGLAQPAILYENGAWTWEAFRDAARKLTVREPDGRFSRIGAALHLPRTWIASNGGAEFDDVKRPTEVLYDSELSREAIHFLQGLIAVDQSADFNQNISSKIGTNDLVGFAQRRIGMASRWLASVPDYAKGGATLGLVPYPKGPGPEGRYATDLGPWGLAISRETQELEAAWKFVSFLAGPEGAIIAADTPGGTPARPVSLGWIPDSVINPYVYGDLLVAGTLRVIARDRQQIQSVIDSELEAVWDQLNSPEAAIEEITRRIQAFLRENPQ